MHMGQHILPNFKLDCCAVREVHRMAHEGSPHRHLACWVKLTPDIAQHQARLAYTLNMAILVIDGASVVSPDAASISPRRRAVLV